MYIYTTSQSELWTVYDRQRNIGLRKSKKSYFSKLYNEAITENFWKSVNPFTLKTFIKKSQYI